MGNACGHIFSIVFYLLCLLPDELTVKDDCGGGGGVHAYSALVLAWV